MKRSLALLVGALGLIMGTGPALAQAPGTPAAPKTTQAAAPDLPAQPKTADPAKKPEAKPQEIPVPIDAEYVYVKMSTSKGDIFLELNQGKAPITVKNFLSYADRKFYNDTIFHRVIDKFMIQGGGLTKDLTEKKDTDKSIKNEWQNGLKNVRGSIAMARTTAPDSARAQFFINVADNAFLDTPRPPDVAAYCVFGRVVGGMDVVDKIKVVKTSPRGAHEAVPVEPILITGITRVPKEEAVKGGTAAAEKN